jgi:hypothetical protein
MPDTWDEAACRARLAAAAEVYDVIACRELDRHAVDDLRGALAEIDRLRAALKPFAELARRPEYQSWPGNASLVIYGTFGAPNLDDCRRAAAALGAARD